MRGVFIFIFTIDTTKEHDSKSKSGLNIDCEKIEKHVLSFNGIWVRVGV